MTTTELIAHIIEREGGFVADPSDRGGCTNFGITAKSWGAYQGIGRQATRSEVKAITRDQAVTFYRQQYIARSPFLSVRYEPLFVQLIDFAVLSGTARAIRWLQRVLDIPITGLMDDRTSVALNRDRPMLVNNGLVAARVKMFHDIVRDDLEQATFLHGWTMRALAFYVETSA